MTEFEINKAVAEKLGYIYTKSFDPCNNIEQAWVIILRYGITIVFQKGKYELATYDGEAESSHGNPLVAAMLVFLEI